MHLTVHIATQQMILHQDNGQQRTYSVSTASKGTGQREGSWQTPLGRHEIKEKIGARCTVNSVFVARRFTGEIYSPELCAQFPDRKDWILTRILWLSGLESGFNLDGDVDTASRYIYIHGTPDSAQMGQPGSRGCIRMRNADIVDLFDRVNEGTIVMIQPT